MKKRKDSLKTPNKTAPTSSFRKKWATRFSGFLDLFTFNYFYYFVEVWLLRARSGHRFSRQRKWHLRRFSQRESVPPSGLILWIAMKLSTTGSRCTTCYTTKVFKPGSIRPSSHWGLTLIWWFTALPRTSSSKSWIQIRCWYSTSSGYCWD